MNAVVVSELLADAVVGGGGRGFGVKAVSEVLVGTACVNSC